MMHENLVFVANSLRFQDQSRAKHLGKMFPIYFYWTMWTMCRTGNACDIVTPTVNSQAVKS